jgi:hypothetical protein
MHCCHVDVGALRKKSQWLREFVWTSFRFCSELAKVLNDAGEFCQRVRGWGCALQAGMSVQKGSVCGFFKYYSIWSKLFLVLVSLGKNIPEPLRQ